MASDYISTVQEQQPKTIERDASILMFESAQADEDQGKNQTMIIHEN